MLSLKDLIILWVRRRYRNNKLEEFVSPNPVKLTLQQFFHVLPDCFRWLKVWPSAETFRQRSVKRVGLSVSDCDKAHFLYRFFGELDI
jgi:hypothetical protein